MIKLMKRIFALAIALCTCLISNSWAAGSTNMVKANGVTLWTESFGAKQNPPILLIIGAGSQAILWPDEFCQKLAKEGFFVIRYDHRDSGKSSAVNYPKQPYTVMDLSKDATAVLDYYKIKKAHIVGFSMGGQIAQFLGAYFPSRVLTLTLMATSTSFKEGFDAFAGNPIEGLSPPKDYYVKWATRGVDQTKQTTNERIKDFVHSWKLLNGDKIPFDTALYTQIAKDSLTRSKLTNPYSGHALAMKASFADHKRAPGLIKAPTLIIHGSEDPVFEVDHAEALHDTITDSELVIIDNMGHNLNTHFYDEIIALIKAQTQKE
jgi:pimeloyl-ACP methyl ester carboxylesterase